MTAFVALQPAGRAPASLCAFDDAWMLDVFDRKDRLCSSQHRGCNETSQLLGAREGRRKMSDMWGVPVTATMLEEALGKEE
jgi:hypothetical protein